MDVRSKKMEPVAQSEDQEDELLSILPIKGYVHHEYNLSCYERERDDLPCIVDKRSLWGPVGHSLRVQPQERLGRLR